MVLRYLPVFVLKDLTHEIILRASVMSKLNLSADENGFKEHGNV